jgi:hypothetical protein
VAAERDAQVRRAVPRLQQAAQEGIERLRLDGGACLGRDHSRDDIRLLRGEAALLHGECRHVAGGVDVGDAFHAAVIVDPEEAFRVMREPVEVRAAKKRQRDHRVGRERLSRQQLEAAACKPDRVALGHEAHALLLEEVPDDTAPPLRRRRGVPFPASRP